MSCSTEQLKSARQWREKHRELLISRRPKYNAQRRAKRVSDPEVRANERLRRKENPEKRARQQREWCLRNPAAAKAIRERTLQKHRLKIRARNRLYQRTHRRELAERRKLAIIAGTRKPADRNKTRAASKRYRARHPERFKASIRKYLANHPTARIAKQLRERLRQCVIKKARDESAMELLGCSVEEACRHLENQFSGEMAWENYGSVWEVDHKRPCASFNLLNQAEQHTCFHYSNLQPLTCLENRRKHAKIA